MARQSELEAWILQRYVEIGFGRGSDGQFIGKSRVKQRLISERPRQKDAIRQIVNGLSHDEVCRTRLPQSSPVSTSPFLSRPQPVEVQSTMQAQSSGDESSCETQSSPTPRRRAASGQNLDSGFVSGAEDNGHKTATVASPSRSTLPINPWVGHLATDEGGVTLGVHSTSIEGVNKATQVIRGGDAQVQSTINPKISELRKFLEEIKWSANEARDDEEDNSDLAALQATLLDDSFGGNENEDESADRSIRNAVLFSANLLDDTDEVNLPQYGLLGSSVRASAMDRRVFLNTNIPFSAFVCGVQGSGKSHTTACMIENCLIPTPILGVLPKPLSALVFNFAAFGSGSSFRPCELAFLASPNSQLTQRLGAKKINVLVSPSNFLVMEALYKQIPGVTVQPFKLHPKDLNISIILTLMSVSQSETTPLYMGIVTKILREMASQRIEGLDYREFRRQLASAGLDRTQKEFLSQRLDLLESFLDLERSIPRPTFAEGEITIIDLSCPFVDASTACILFKIGMGIYLGSDSAQGRVIVLDEAHKYMTDTRASKELTESLMRVIREQRHYGARVIISTQEPTISPKLIDLCSITVMHRFSSPEWLDVLQRHILLADEDGNSRNKIRLLQEIMQLETGEALVFAPSAICGNGKQKAAEATNGNALLRMRMRKRVTWDGGKSLLCV